MRCQVTQNRTCCYAKDNERGRNLSNMKSISREARVIKNTIFDGRMCLRLLLFLWSHKSTRCCFIWNCLFFLSGATRVLILLFGYCFFVEAQEINAGKKPRPGTSLILPSCFFVPSRLLFSLLFCRFSCLIWSLILCLLEEALAPAHLFFLSSFVSFCPCTSLILCLFLSS